MKENLYTWSVTLSATNVAQVKYFKAGNENGRGGLGKIVLRNSKIICLEVSLAFTVT